MNDLCARPSRGELEEWKTNSPGFRVSFGAAGLANAWASVRPGHSIVLVVSCCVSALWLVCLAHAARTTFVAHRTQSTAGRFSPGLAGVLAPGTVMLVLGQIAPWAPEWVLGAWAVSLAVIVVIGVMSLHSRIAHRARFRIDGEIFLPAVTAPLVVSLTAGQIGLGDGGVILLCVGVAFWLPLVVLLLGSLATTGWPPSVKVPTLAIPSGSPALAGSAWMTLNGGVVDTAVIGFGGLAIVAVVVQLAAVRAYVKVRWSPSLWAFTFPSAALVGYAGSVAKIAGSTTGTVFATVGASLLTVFVLSLIAFPYVSRCRRRRFRFRKRSAETFTITPVG